MKEPRWVNREALLYLHTESLARFGGLDGIRDNNLLGSALARPRNRFLYEPQSDIASLAAAYGFGLTSNHAFHDGNKRTGFQAVGLFLLINGYNLVATQVDAVQVMLRMAAGRLTEEEFATWIRGNCKKCL
ncbi:MAG: type II toxin-antitoxin system death-on-curing family toxin [Candidatus Acidiferrum sp.]